MCIWAAAKLYWIQQSYSHHFTFFEQGFHKQLNNGWDEAQPLHLFLRLLTGAFSTIIKLLPKRKRQKGQDRDDEKGEKPQHPPRFTFLRCTRKISNQLPFSNKDSEKKHLLLFPQSIYSLKMTGGVNLKTPPACIHWKISVGNRPRSSRWK